MITNIERVTLENATFPAITICHWGSYKRDFYSNNTFVRTENIFIKSENVSRITNFIDEHFFYSRELNRKVQNFDNYVEYFKILEGNDCLRFNGFDANKSIKLIEANSSEDNLIVVLKDSYRENKSLNEHYIYSFNPHFYLPFLPNLFYIYITDNYLNSFEKVQHQLLEMNNVYNIEIEKESIEHELPEPYNRCKESPIDEHYHRSNCIETCIYREIKKKYNCTFLRSLFAIPGLRQCNITDQSMNKFQQEFLVGCKKECPESCYSEKFVHYLTTIQTTTRYLNNHTYLRVSFHDFSHLNISQIPKIDVYTFLNNIGGGLGLFMGITFPSLIEFIEFIFETISIALFNGNVL